MVQAADAGQANDPGLCVWTRLHGPRGRRCLSEAEVGPIVVVVGKVLREEPSKMVLAQDHYVIEELPADAADPALGDAVLPRVAVAGPGRIDTEGLHCRARAEVRQALEQHLRDEPEKVSKSRIKRLRGISRPQYRLRVGEIRVFYDVTGHTVEVLAIVAKAEAESWLDQFGKLE
jgi:mRNA-degrading endonuclease RelE of RelBE toxin-antitoxin system